MNTERTGAGEPPPSSSNPDPGGTGLNSLRVLGWVALIAALVTLWLLPLPDGSKLMILAIAAFAGVFTLLESTNRGKALAAAMIALLVFYLGVTLQRAWVLMTSDLWISKGLGAALLVIPVVGAWALVRELLFGIRVEQLGRSLGAEGGLPVDDLPRHPSGRVVREAADAQFPRWQAEVEAAPGDWRTWYRLSLAYSASGDTRRARKAMRDAVRISRDSAAGRGSEPQSRGTAS